MGRGAARAGTCGNPYTYVPRRITPARVDVTIWLDPERAEVHAHEDKFGDGPALGFATLSADQRADAIAKLRHAIDALEARSNRWPRAEAR